MLVAVTGASGLIGTALTRRLRAEGHQVLRLTRSRPTGADQVQWDPMAGQLDPDALTKADAVVHLAARNLGEQLRWTARTKRELLSSRVEGTALVARTLAGLQRHTDGPVLASRLKRAILRKDPTFDEADHGFRSFTELLRHLAAQRVVELGEGSAQGDPQVTFPSAASPVDDAFRLLTDVVADLGSPVL
ncbi:MAG: NAD-dependent epimerase/dehydratase family protein, partial [Actinomycetota bacterium]